MTSTASTSESLLHAVSVPTPDELHAEHSPRSEPSQAPSPGRGRRRRPSWEDTACSPENRSDPTLFLPHLAGNVSLAPEFALVGAQGRVDGGKSGPNTVIAGGNVQEELGSGPGPDSARTAVLPQMRVFSPERSAAPARDEYAWKRVQDPYGDRRLWRPELFTATVKATGAVLPRPPSQRTEKHLYDRRRMRLHLLGMITSTPFLLYAQLGLLDSSMRLWVLLPAVTMAPVVVVIRVLLEIGTKDFDSAAHYKLIERWAPETYPSVDVMLPVCGESLEVLRNTWKHVAVLQDKYPGRATVHVLDDAARGEVATIAAEFGFRYGSRPDRGWFKKAGNLNFGLATSSGEFILILDADFVPSPEFLAETLPYFEADPQLGILQTPQFFRNAGDQSFIERGAASCQELFYRAVQVARDQRDAVVCCGTNAVYRRAALAENNGMTLISHSEDAHTGIALRRLGWRVRYVPINLASGLCPADVNSFFDQQYRWCVGTISIVADRGFWTTRMPLRARLYDIVGFLYYAETAVFAILSPLIAVILCAVSPQEVVLRNYLLVLPSALYTFVLTPLWHRVRCGVDMWPVTVVVSWSHLFAFWDAVRGRQMSWRPSGSAKKKSNRRLWVGLWVWSLGVAVLGVTLSAWRMLELNTAAFTPVFLPAVFYLVTILRILGTTWTSTIDA